ncbi:MAG: ATP-binding protein [Candidatus Micrarchaeia archaeon]
MKFYNREAEKKALEDAIKKSPALILIKGRRRVGKTALILNSIKENAIYFFIDNKKTEKNLLFEFEEILKKELNLPNYIKIEKWEHFFQIIFESKKTIILDEFQRILGISPSAINQLQKFWDLNPPKNALILSGSNIGMIKKIFINEGSPLFKRATMDMTLKSLDFSVCKKILKDLGIKDFENQFKIYSIIGGIPYYYSLLQNETIESWKDVVKIIFLNPFSPLKNEVNDTLIEGFGKEHLSYYAVLNAIALGKTTKKEISDFSGILPSSISPYLYDLGNLLDIIEYEIPITEKKPWKTKLGRFILKDNFFRFWFKFIFRHQSIYEKANYSYLFELIEKDFDSFSGFSFENVAREFILKLNNKNNLPVKFDKIGRWWDRKGQEIDMVLISDRDDAIMLIECKWKEDANPEMILSSLMEKEKFLNHKKKNVFYGIIAKSFKNKTKNAIVFDINDLEKNL